MNSQVNILDTTKLQFDGEFDAQVEEILCFVRLTVDKVHLLKLLFDDLEHAMQYVARGCHVEPFGSVVTGLGIKTSDVDCYVALPEGIQPTIGHLIHARNILNRFHRKFSNIFAITNAKVPIIKFIHIPTQCECDINFKTPAGVRNSKLIGFLLNSDKRVLKLSILVKYWSKIHKFTGTNLMSNYALIIMVIFYLQLLNILPSVYELQRNLPDFYVDGWNTAFEDSARDWDDTTNTDSLYELLGGFFKCYSMFDFKNNVISPYIGRVMSKKSFDNFDLPEEFGLYKEKVSKDVRIKLNTGSKICVQDPFEHNRNCTLGVFDRLAGRIHAHFLFASKKFEEGQPNNFLRAILTQDPSNDPSANGKPPPKHIFNNKIKKQNQKQNKKALQTGLHKMFALFQQNLAKGDVNCLPKQKQND